MALFLHGLVSSFYILLCNISSDANKNTSVRTKANADSATKAGIKLNQTKYFTFL